MSKTFTPLLVSIGIPVRNGDKFVDGALFQIVNQSYKNLEIIISDNNSIDNTAEICKKYSYSDKRIKYFRQNNDLSALENFKFVFDQATSEYFMWAACDDRRDLNYVECLLNTMLSNSNRASLVFSDVKKFNDFSSLQTIPKLDYEFSLSSDANFWKKILFRSYIKSGYLHIYGLFRKKYLEDYTWPNIEIGPDRPLLFYLSCKGDFARAEGTCFYCYKPVIKKTISGRAKDNSSSRIKRFPYVRLAWLCACIGSYAERAEGRSRSVPLMFVLFYLSDVINKLSKKLNSVKLKLVRGRFE